MNAFTLVHLRVRHAVTNLTLVVLAAASAVVFADVAPKAPQASSATQIAQSGSDEGSTQTDIGRVSTGPAADDTSTVAPSPTRDRAAAIEEKKQAPNLIEVQPLEEIRKLPDINTAEALQRLPGVSLETDTGEGRFVSIRGLDSDLNGTTYGGVRLPPSNPASPFGGGRATAFDVLPTGLIGGIELTKTNRPDLDAEALGGTINLVPRSGDEHGGKLFVEGTAGGGYEALRDTPVFDVDSTVGGSFDGGSGIGGLFAGPRAISVLLTGVYYDDQRGIDDVEAAYSDQQSQGVPDKLLGELDLRRYDYHRQRYGIGGEIDAKANEFNRFFLRFLMAGYWEGKQNHHLDLTGLDSGCTAATDGGPDDCSAATAKPNPYPNGFFAPANADNGVPEYDQDLTDSKERIQNSMLVLGGSSITEGIKFDYRTSVAQGTDKLPYSYKGKFVDPNPVGTAYDNVTDPRYPLFQTTDGTDPADPANYQLSSIGFTESRARDLEFASAIDATIPVEYWQAPGELKFGLGLRLREKNNDQFTDKFKAKGTILLSAVDVGGPQVFYKNHYDIGPTPNRYGLIGLTNDPTMTKNSGEDTIGDAEAFQDDNENVYAGYGQYTATFGRIGVLAGVRLEQTEATYRANQVDENSDTGDITLVARKASYFNYFPTLQGRYEFRKDLIGRVTYSTAIARPGFNQITASTIVSDNSVTIGNPNLKPTTGNNFDGTLEWYPEAGAVASVGFFDKEFRNYILPSQQSDTTYPDVDGVAQITTFSNGSARAYGAESAMTQQLKMLPDPFDGLGISANITLVHSDAEIHPGVHGLLPSTSRVTWNAAGFYEKGPVNVRIAAGFVGQNLFAFGSDPSTDIYSRRRLTLDIGSSYAFTHYFKLFFDAKNLLNTPLEFTEGKSDARPIQREFYDITLLGGVRAAFD